MVDNFARMIALKALNEGGGGGGGTGTSDYNKLTNLPKLNGTLIKGNLQSSDFGLLDNESNVVHIGQSN